MLLEHAYVVHEGDDAIGRHRTGVESGGSEQRSDVERHRALGGVEYKQLAPRQTEQCHLHTTITQLIVPATVLQKIAYTPDSHPFSLK